MGKNQLKVNLFGSTFTIQADTSTEHLKEIIDYFKDKVEEIKVNAAHANPLKIVILTALNIVDELFKEKQKSKAALKRPEQEPNEEVEKITRHLIEKIDDVLLES